jgi:hypothetical protein
MTRKSESVGTFLGLLMLWSLLALVVIALTVLGAIWNAAKWILHRLLLRRVKRLPTE